MLDPWDPFTYQERGLADADRLPPLDDAGAAARYEGRYPWAFDKIEHLSIYAKARGFDFEHGYGAPPDGYPWPCIVKPWRNLAGLASGIRTAPPPAGPHEYWQRRLTGEHFSLDVPVLNGSMAGPPACARGIEDRLHPGRFLLWQVAQDYQPADLTIHVSPFLYRLSKYRGILNLEFRRVSASDPDLRLIELHLRPSVEFFPIYGEACVRSILDFCAGDVDLTLPAREGAALIQPRGARSLDLVGECEERAWRTWIHYVTPHRF